jgi:hypothetical protein
VYIVVTLVIELACAFVADLVRKVNTVYTYLSNSDTFRLIIDYLGVIIAVVAAIMAMFVSLTVVAIIFVLLVFPEKREQKQVPFIIYSE